jgi:deoxyhypusine synthase
MYIKVDVDVVDSLVVKSLIQQYDNLYHDYINGTQIPTFCHDPEEDSKKMRKFLKSLERVISWYSNPDEFKVFKERYAEAF